MNPVNLRNEVLPEIRKVFSAKNLQEAITPLGVTSSGIEPYIDPLQISPGLFLPTSPEISLKKTLAMQPEKYNGLYEIAHAFREEIKGLYHLREFTMVEWYKKNTSYEKLSDDVMEILRVISNKKNGVRINLGNPVILTVKDLFHNEYHANISSTWGIEKYMELARSREIYTGENHNNDSFLLIEIFTLLYDQALGNLKNIQNRVVFIKDYPPFLRGMARLNLDGWAMRLEGLINNIEICSGYQEEDDKNILKDVWEENNKLRKKLNKDAYPVDENLLEVLSLMKGVSGMALGLERSLMSIFEINDIRLFQLDPNIS